VLSGRCSVCSLSYAEGIEHRYGLVSAGERRVLSGHFTLRTWRSPEFFRPEEF
jgi:hypothetical protein